MREKSAEILLTSMKPGRAYRRAELKSYSASVDRDLAALVQKGEVRRAAPGLYYRPGATAYGLRPAEDSELVRAFLQDDDFLITSPNLFNSLGLGLTQVYNHSTVYNRKRHTKVTLDGRLFDFRRPRNFPPKLSEEFLIVELLDNVKHLAEELPQLEDRIRSRVNASNYQSLLKTAKRYGKRATQRLLAELKPRDG